MKIKVLLALFIVICTNVSAQVGEQRHDFSLGVNAGVSLNKVAFTPKINQKFYMAPFYGVTMRYTSERYYGMWCAFQAELNYASTGWEENIHSAQNEKLPDTYQRDLKYFQLPILANLGFGKMNHGFKGYIVAGPQIGYLLSDKEKRSEIWTTRPSGQPDRTNNITAQYGLKVENKFEYGITAGAGCELTTRIGHFLIEGRYYMALSNIFSNSKTDPFPRSSNGTIVAKATYLIDLHR